MFLGKHILGSPLWRFFLLPPQIRESYRVTAGIISLKERWPQTSSKEAENERPVFIFSAGWGSGSTLVQRLVVSSGEIAMWGEPMDHSIIIPQLSASIGCITPDWPMDKFFHHHNIQTKELANEWIANLTPPLHFLKESHRCFIQHWLGSSSKQLFSTNRWGLKEVRYTIDHARYLKWLFPKAKFIFVYRDLLKAYLSIKGVSWYSSWPNYHFSSPLTFSHHWTYLLNGFLSGYKDVDGFLLKYEDLISGNYNFKELAQYLDVKKIDNNVLEKKIRSRGAKKNLNIIEKVILMSVGRDLRKQLGYHS